MCSHRNCTRKQRIKFDENLAPLGGPTGNPTTRTATKQNQTKSNKPNRNKEKNENEKRRRRKKKKRRRRETLSPPRYQRAHPEIGDWNGVWRKFESLSHLNSRANLWDLIMSAHQLESRARPCIVMYRSGRLRWKERKSFILNSGRNLFGLSGQESPRCSNLALVIDLPSNG